MSLPTRILGTFLIHRLDIGIPGSLDGEKLS